ncbi:MAG: hypothetical protein KA792_04395 [Bacteroidales bacterium]|nr:hypothetical protein [Bacteroidales bacterium]
MNTIIPKLINIFQININKIIITATDDTLNKGLKANELKMDFFHNTAFNFNKKNIRIRLIIIIDAFDKQNNECGIHFEYEFEFHLHIENLEEFIIKKKRQKQIDSYLGATLLGIVYSSARGIIFENSKNTLLNGVILPVIAPDELLKKTY